MKRTLTNKTAWIAGAIGLCIGVAALLGVRFLTYSPPSVHYHANFAVYINGQQEQFKGAQYYQEVAICTATSGITIPQQRAHMHDNVGGVIHVHDHATTWGQFFENLGWYVGEDTIITDDGRHLVADDTNKVNIIIDGQDYTGLMGINNVVIKDKARLLVSFGPSDQALLKAQYKTVPNTAAKYDASKDPASCSGAEAITTRDRLHHLL